MAHAVESIALARKPAWHGLGTVVEGAMTAEEALRIAHLDWDVEKRQDYYYNNDGSLSAAPGCYKIVRTDRLDRNVLGSCTEIYQPLQNRDAFTFFDPLVSRKEAIYETAMSLYEGKRIVLTAKLPGEIRVNGNDISNKYVMLTNGHDGKSSLIIKLVVTRIVCSNTLAIALNENGDTLKLRHTTNLNTRLLEASSLMGFANQMYGELQEAFQSLAAKRVGNDEADEYFEELVGAVPKRLAKVQELYETGAGADQARGTLWGAYNAVTEYVDWYARYRNENSKVNQILFDDGAALKVRALERALELV